MSQVPNFSYQYQVGGTLPNDSLTYVRRQADNDLYNYLLAGKFCYVLNARQTGKSSLILQTISSLEATGIKCVYIYLPECGSKVVTHEQFYSAIANELVKRLHLDSEIQVVEWWREHHFITSCGERLINFIETIILKKISSNIVVFIDEIDSILSLKSPIDDFFSVIRNCCEKYNRITFALFGVATTDELIQNEQKSPFEIGKAIELGGFTPIEARSLEKGLQGKVSPTKIRVAIGQVLKWTDGQPFLTCKICKLIQELPFPIPEGQETQKIKELVESHIIKNWEQQEKGDHENQHLTTIRDQIVMRARSSSSLLELYKEIRQKGEIDVDNTKEQLYLRISGLVIRKQGKLKVKNKIYEAVFNLDWVKQEINNLRPYALSFEAWLASNSENSSYLLQEKKLKDSLVWLFSKNRIAELSREELEFIKYSIRWDSEKELQRIKEKEKKHLEEKERAEQERAENQKIQHELNRTIKQERAENQKIQDELCTKFKGEQKQKRIWKGTTVCLFIGFFLIVTSNPLSSYFRKIFISESPQPEGVSSGERRLFRSNDYYIERGIDAFEGGKNQKAIQFFEKATEIAPTDPEPRIYLNNAQARQNRSRFRFSLAVIVPVDNKKTHAQEILRGVADAQTKFNANAKISGGDLLEIVIINDQDDPKVAVKMAKEIVADESILGVIAHKLNNEALQEYENAELAVVVPIPNYTISPSKSKVFFQTSLSDIEIAEKLANFAKQVSVSKKVVIFFDSKNSTVLRDSLKTQFTELKGTIWKSFDLNDSMQDENAIKAIIEECIKNKVDIAVLLPSSETNSLAISIASANSQISSDQKLKLLSSYVMYNPATLIEGGSVVEDLILAVPWIDNTSYGKTAKVRWKGKVSWRTATSYDATQALINSLDSEATRKTILDNLKEIKLLQHETSGDILQFSASGERTGQPYLVEVDRDASAPEGAKFGFKPLPN